MYVFIMETKLAVSIVPSKYCCFDMIDILVGFKHVKFFGGSRRNMTFELPDCRVVKSRKETSLFPGSFHSGSMFKKPGETRKFQK